MRFLIPVLFVATVLQAESPLTVVLDPEKPVPSAALQEMQREMQRLFDEGGRRLDWKLRSELDSEASVPDLVLVKLRGSCRMSAMPELVDERGPLAITHTADGEVLPFSEVQCDRLRQVTGTALHGSQRGQADRLLGRAMARVVAHEIWHITSNRRDHAESGITQRALSGKQLVADHLDFDEHSAGELKVTHQR